MSEVVKVSAIGVMCAVICVIVRNYSAEFLVPTRLSGILMILSLSILLVSPIIEFLTQTLAEHISVEYVGIIVKALCIAYLTEISGELCRDCGEGNIALGIETVGKLELVALTIPLLEQVLAISEELLQW